MRWAGGTVLPKLWIAVLAAVVRVGEFLRGAELSWLKDLGRA
ncbi:hypothetical protein NVSP9465_01460 [Novosphingobium sp. CECT 9465]|nr:hypothetical protein NVSP9465_01460 [Novosphingobium sp. CECT 9465]